MTESNRQSNTLAAVFTPARIVALALTALAVIFVLQNRDSTSINLFWITVQSPMWFTLLAVFVVGLVTGVLTTSRRAKRSAS
ncbi:LapA family protein [Rhodococcus triatomae]|uniref:lipopolysaccharide assembly protein LapA domain-containing protein n=1 Tax=Rhodococcus triatomae TaxID=300028 RepID=UPI000932F549|nr:LapA family protein [Rhodococcus triatomae]QNG17355.1 LapA family protein [Rhodococcus triatomae]QNG22978.1 LapA family protein [Rhodococcus triatomae]